MMLSMRKKGVWREPFYSPASISLAGRMFSTPGGLYAQPSCPSRKSAYAPSLDLPMTELSPWVCDHKVTHVKYAQKRANGERLAQPMVVKSNVLELDQEPHDKGQRIEAGVVQTMLPVVVSP
ncbi:hypothetical protein FRC12_017292 [Ceratobasidium sp. 428]|nr:hypothetical protein FRC12_017292 [Ceratobasidium sp. 428]